MSKRVSIHKTFKIPTTIQSNTNSPSNPAAKQNKTKPIFTYQKIFKLPFLFSVACNLRKHPFEPNIQY